MKRFFSIHILYILVLCTFIVGCSHQKALEIKIGDYVQFGKYNDVPILWRVIHIDKGGDILLFSDRLISLKAFDAAGNYHKNNDRINYGSNYWKDSNIRQWLNSSKKANTITWMQNPPSKENMFEQYTPYANEKGFLADGNFTENERNSIKAVTHKFLLDEIDKNKKDGGEETLTLTSDIREVVQNYDNAYYKNIEDKVFLLSIKELHDYVWENKNVLGKDYYMGKPTKESIENFPEKHTNLDYKHNWSYWLRSPSGSSPAYVRMVKSNGYIYDYFASFSGHGGIRPALWLNTSSITLKSGSGLKSEPYIINTIN